MDNAKQPQTTGMILLLSSEPLVRSVMKEVLEGAGHTVLATGSLGVAVDILAETAIDLLITHPYVENIPGHEAATYLRSRNPHKMAVLIVAGLLDDDRLQYRADLQKFEIFPPPFTAAEFLDKVEKALNTVRSDPDSTDFQDLPMTHIPS